MTNSDCKCKNELKTKFIFFEIQPVIETGSKAWTSFFFVECDDSAAKSGGKTRCKKSTNTWTPVTATCEVPKPICAVKDGYKVSYE